MNKFIAFIVSLIIVIILFFSLPQNNTSEKEIVTIGRVIDGDTIQLTDNTIVRLLNINSPEKNTFNHEQAALYLTSLINKSISLETTGTDKYNRVLAKIYAPEYVNLRLVELGLASKFLVQESELKKFAEAEEYAISHEKGIWKKSNLYGCFKSTINEKSEYVKIIKLCPEAKWDNITLKDESRKSFVINNISQAEETITLYSNLGKNTQNQLYWNSKDSIWNNDRDSLYMIDNKGNIIEYETYGY